MDSKEWLFDRRVVKRNLKKAVYTLKEYQEYLAKLPDVAAHAETVDPSSYRQGLSTRTTEPSASRGSSDEDA